MRRELFILLLLVILPACRSASSQDQPPQEIIQQSAQRMQAIRGFEVSIVRDGASAFLDSGQSISFGRLTGHFVAPDRVQAKVRVIGPGLVVEVDVISIGSTQWQTNVITGAWEQLPEDWGFNPATLLQGDAGLPAILTADLSELEATPGAELEEMPGKKLYLISGRLAGETLYDLSNGLIGPEAMDAQLWIDPTTFDLHRAILSEYRGDTAKERTWQIDFWSFDTVIEIQPPL